MTFQWVITFGQVISTATILSIGAGFYWLTVRSYRARILGLEEQILVLRTSVHRLHVLLNVAEAVNNDG